jgi:hypothetical protein
MIVNGVQISIQAAVDGKHPATGVPPAPITVRIADDGVYRIVDDGQYRIID